jgi:hypothetical protein
MKRFVAWLLGLMVPLGILIAGVSCNGADEVTGLGRGHGDAVTPRVSPAPTVTPHPNDLCHLRPDEC